MEISPDAEDLALRTLAEYAAHLRSESERIAICREADRVSLAYVGHAAENLRIKRHISHLPGSLTSFGMILSGTSIGLTVATLPIDDPAGVITVGAAALLGIVSLGFLLAGAGLHLRRYDR